MRTHGLFLLSGSLFCVLLVSGCGSTQPTYTGPPSDASASATVEKREESLRAAAQRWRGTPHEWGGTTLKGVDCSGLVQTIYRQALDQSLPRTTRAQARTGSSISSSALQPGDLVFFHVDTRKGRHVGIYLSDGDFLHASSSEGVTVSSLTNPYWKQRWWQARRLLADSTSGNRTHTAPAPSQTVGW